MEKSKEKGTGSGNAERTKEETLQKFEAELKLLAEKIKKVGEKEVDLDDDEESPFEELGKLQKRFWDFWTKLCKHAGCNPSMTGREVDTKVKIQDPILKDAHPELVKKLEKYVRKHPSSYIPSFAEVRNIVLHEKHGIPGGADIDVDAVAHRLLEAVVEETRKKRMCDLRESISGPKDRSHDAAHEDPVFLEKLDENKKLNDEAWADLPTIIDNLIRSRDEQGESEEDGESESEQGDGGAGSGSHDNADTPTDILLDDESDDDFQEAPPAKKLRR